MWKVLVCKCDDRLVIKQFPYSLRQEALPRYEFSIQMRDEMCLMNVRRKSLNFDPTTVECCSTVDLSAEDQKRALAVAHDVVQDQSLPWRKDMVLNVSRRRCVSMMNVLC